jgi:hypothetical protein
MVRIFIFANDDQLKIFFFDQRKGMEQFVQSFALVIVADKEELEDAVVFLPCVKSVLQGMPFHAVVNDLNFIGICAVKLEHFLFHHL